MRDALSIMDKIVSFTNGELTYANTLEHLNILDAEYYFRLLDCMLQQDLAGALLLYDGINQKGFEGDLVLNGFAEFIRNLLVCKDAKAANLLEVVESFRDKYVETSRNVSMAVLISSLNILNEAEINYKAARNKRLHVELVLIKLCYLQQAIELTAEVGGISKKKLIESVKPMAFRNIAPLGVKEQPKSKPEKAATTHEKLIIETPAIEQMKVAEDNRPYQSQTSNKLSALDKIRKQYQGNEASGNGHSNHPLELESLQTAWAGYILNLKEAKSPAVQSFELAHLQIKDENCFEVITSNNIQQKFIEQERNHLFAFLQQQLKNRLLQISVFVFENPQERKAAEISLSSREQFIKMVEQYPLLLELKERLRLDLDY